jgi:hypothetical protein
VHGNHAAAFGLGDLHCFDRAPQRATRPHMALYRAVESRPVMAAGMMTWECVGRKSI